MAGFRCFIVICFILLLQSGSLTTIVDAGETFNRTQLNSLKVFQGPQAFLYGGTGFEWTSFNNREVNLYSQNGTVDIRHILGECPQAININPTFLETRLPGLKSSRITSTISSQPITISPLPFSMPVVLAIYLAILVNMAFILILSVPLILLSIVRLLGYHHHIQYHFFYIAYNPHDIRYYLYFLLFNSYDSYSPY